MVTRASDLHLAWIRPDICHLSEHTAFEIAVKLKANLDTALTFIKAIIRNPHALCDVSPRVYFENFASELFICK